MKDRRTGKELIPYTVSPPNKNCPVVHATDPAHARHLVMFELGLKKWPPGVTCVPVATGQEPKSTPPGTEEPQS